MDRTPQRVYVDRRADREAALAAHVQRDLSISRFRTATAVATLATAWLGFGAHLVSAWWILAPIGLFLCLVSVHDRVLRARQRAAQSVAFYDAGLRRIEDRWMGRGNTRNDFAPSGHPYAADLDLFGRGSLYELLCGARTRAGQECLARWLLEPAESGVILERQEAIRELRDRLDFREDLALLAEETETGLSGLEAWAEAPLQLEPAWIRIGAITFAAAGVAALFGWWRMGIGPGALIAVLVLGQLFLFRLRQQLARTFHGVFASAAALETVSGLLARLERETGESALLLRLQEDLRGSGVSPSGEIRRLVRLLDVLNLQGNMFFAPVARLLLWSVHFAVAIDRWRSVNGPQVRSWLRAIGEYEAIASMSAYAYEHPADPLPEVTEEGPLFVAEQIGHPLLPASTATRNDISLGEGVRLYLVSGSNMSGKSTLLRTIGINTVLALSGAPVRAVHLRLSRLRIGASLRTEDSLQGGVSRFYAEILRLRQVTELAGGDPPLLFLLDEILHGTNSHDRLIGAEAIARTLISRSAIGLITTHDLALARIEADPELAAANVHFEDQLTNGQMAFDYQLRPGVVTKSNALELMRAVGLDV